jgi:hypothetical protein
MSSSVLLDTTFLISLVDSTRPNHLKANEFYKYFLDHKFAMKLSSIAACEFSIKQPIEDLPLDTFQMLPFNIPESTQLSHLYMHHFKNVGYNRIAVKDDFKLISQAAYNKIDFIITEDEDLLNKIIRPLNEKSLLKTKPLFCPNGVNKEFNIPPPPMSLFDQTLQNESEEA